MMHLTTSHHRWGFSLLLAFLINKVAAQHILTVEAFLGETVILPCKTVQTAQNVYWRYMDSITVCDIISGKANFEEQDPVFKDRVQLFPLEFVKGNFSIKLCNVDWSKEGIYTCNFPNTIVPETVQLSIKESRPEISARSQVNGDNRGQPTVYLIFSMVLLFFM